MEFIKNITSGSVDKLVVRAHDAADAEIFAQEWLEDNYNDDGYSYTAGTAVESEDEDGVFTVPYAVQ